MSNLLLHFSKSEIDDLLVLERGEGPYVFDTDGRADPLPARGALGATVRRLLDDGAIELVTGLHTREIAARDGRLEIRDGARALLADEVIATTGFRPDLSLLAELRLDFDDRVGAYGTIGVVAAFFTTGARAGGPVAAAVYAAAVGYTTLLWTLAALALVAVALAIRAETL